MRVENSPEYDEHRRDMNAPTPYRAKSVPLTDAFFCGALHIGLNQWLTTSAENSRKTAMKSSADATYRSRSCLPTCQLLHYLTCQDIAAKTNPVFPQCPRSARAWAETAGISGTVCSTVSLSCVRFCLCLGSAWSLPIWNYELQIPRDLSRSFYKWINIFEHHMACRSRRDKLLILSSTYQTPYFAC